MERIPFDGDLSAHDQFGIAMIRIKGLRALT